MPESEPKPRPLESVPAGSGQGWKAVLKNGKQVVVHEIPVAPAAAAAAAPRLQRLAEHPHPSLSPILAWGTDANGVWVAVEPNEGTPLSAILSRGRFTPHAAASLGLQVLSGVAALHEAGVAMGGFDATAIRLTSNGAVRLAGHPVAAVRGAPSQSDLRADVRSCGMAICAAFGVDPAGAPAPPDLAPGLVVTMRSMASGTMGPAVDRAQGALREMAGPLLAPDRQLAAQSEIALRAGGREMPSITPFVPEAQKAPAAADEPPPRPASYEPPPRALETYSGLPAMPQRPVETYSPPAGYQPAASTPAAPPASPAPAAPVAPAVPSWDSQPPAPAAAETPAAAPVPAAAVPSAFPAAAPMPTPAPAAATADPVAPPSAPVPPATPATPAPAPWEPAAAPVPPEPASQPPSPQPVFASAAPAPAPAEPAAPASEPLDWPAPGSPLTNPAGPSAAPGEPLEPAAPKEQTGKPTWTPVETGSWTPGPGGPVAHVSSSEWTGEATPIPQSVPEEFRAEPAPRKRETVPPDAAPPSFLAAAAAATPAVASSATSTAPPVAPRAAAPAPARKPAARREPLFPSGRPGWLIPAAVGVIVVLLLGITGVVLLANHGATTTTHAQTSPHPTASPKPSASPTNVIQAVPVYAPAAATPVTSVIIDPANSSCQINGPCKIEVDIKFSAPQHSNVSFIVKYFDRCKGTTTDLQGANFTPPGFNLVILDKSLTLPQGAKSAAIVAVTQTPAAAASAPVLLGADSC